jgi:hypothetical protein
LGFSVPGGSYFGGFVMSRPIKQGLEYFALDVNSDEKIELIEAKYGIAGFGILIKLYQKIYKEGYYIKWTEESILLFSKRIDVNIDKVKGVIEDCFNYNLFVKDLYSKYKILTSAGIQKRYLSAIIRRSEVSLCKDFVIVDINGIKVNINWVNVDNKYTKESTVQNSKQKEIKAEERIVKGNPNPNPLSGCKNKQPGKEEIQIKEENPEPNPEAEEKAEIQEPQKTSRARAPATELLLEDEYLNLPDLMESNAESESEPQEIVRDHSQEAELDRKVMFLSTEPEEHPIAKELEPKESAKLNTMSSEPKVEKVGALDWDEEPAPDIKAFVISAVTNEPQVADALGPDQEEIATVSKEVMEDW